MGKIGCILTLESAAKDVNALRDLGKRLAMQVVGMSPKFITAQDVPPAVVEQMKLEFENKQKELKGRFAQ
jgi:translation elongation factor EF-Ts